ncbi:MAG: hypothetical protein ACO34J_16435, partial [Prochlorothrix sp.]
MPIILAPGVHPPDLTEGFCRDFQATWPAAVPRPPLWVVPPTVPPFSPCHHWRWLQEQVLASPHPPAPSPRTGEGELDSLDPLASFSRTGEGELDGPHPPAPSPRTGEGELERYQSLSPSPLG